MNTGKTAHSVINKVKLDFERIILYNDVTFKTRKIIIAARVNYENSTAD